MSHPPPITGELVVVALKAEKLQHQAPSKQDPFCLFRVGDIVKRTKTDHGGGLYPIWDDQVNIPVAAGHHQIHVQIFDKDTHPNNLMGEGVVDLSKVLREKEHDGYFPLTFRGRQGCGDIYLELTFYSAQNTARPQQQVRYQYPPGYVPGGQTGGYRPPLQHLQQHRPPPMQQHRPPPPHMRQRPPPLQMQPQQHRPLPMQQPPMQQHQPPPMQQRQPPIQQHRSPPMQQQHRPPPQNHHTMPPTPQHHSPFPQPQPRPSNSMGTAQIYSPVMPSPQPLLSAPYNPSPSPGSRPANLNYPDQRQSSSYPPTPPPGGFHDPSHHHHQQQQGPPPPMGYHQPGMRPMPPGGFNQRPNSNANYPPY